MHHGVAMNPPTTSVPEVPAKTTFRVLMEQLQAQRGEVPEWPTLLAGLLTAEFDRQREMGFCYSSEVFKDRDLDDPTMATSPEKRKVRDLYHLCLKQSNGCLTLGEDRYWLLGYEWPNQGSERMRRADLVGLNVAGGLTVFECKLDDNPYGPFASVLEGLDYLTCLAARKNFEKLQSGFVAWSKKQGRVPPTGFENTCPDRAQVHEVIVLAPAGYYRRYSNSERGLGWDRFGIMSAGSVRIRFAQSDFATMIGTWCTTTRPT